MASTLKLKIEKGPRSGKTLEFTSRATIRLGRVVRGNNLPIKDPGNSSKHLKIDFDTDSSNWVISDLDSSNGTLLNNSKLNPFDSVVICDGDEIKIGEVTLIRVEFDGIDCRRNPRRGVPPPREKDNAAKLEKEVTVVEEIPPKRNAARVKVAEAEEVSVRVGEAILRKQNAARVKVEMVDEDEEVRIFEERNVEELERGGRRRGRERGRGRTKKGSVLEEGGGEEREEPRVGTRRTRRGEVELLNLDNVVPARRTRRAKNVVKSDVVLDKVVECDEEEENVRVVEKKTTRGRPIRKKAVECDVVENSVVEKVPEGKGWDLDCSEEAENVGVVGKKRVRGGSIRKKVMESNVVEKVLKRKGSNLDVDGCKEVDNVGVLEEKRVRGGSVRKKVVEVDVVEKGPEGKGLDLDVDGGEEAENVGVIEEKRLTRGSSVLKVLDSNVMEVVSEGKALDLVQDFGMKVVNVSVVEEKRMTRGGSVRKKVVNTNVVEKVPEEKELDVDLDDRKDVEDEGVVQKKRTATGCGRKKNGDSKGSDDISVGVLGDKMPVKVLECDGLKQMDMEQPCEGPLIDDGDQQQKVEDNSNNKVSEVEVSDQVGVPLCAKVQPSLEPLVMDDSKEMDNVKGIKNQILMKYVDFNSVESDRDVVEDMPNLDVFGPEVSGQVNDTREKQCEEPLPDNVQGGILTHNKYRQGNDSEQAGDSVCSKEQICSEPVDETAQKNVPINASNDDALEVEISAQIGSSPCSREQPCVGLMDDTVQQNDGVVCISHVEEGSCDKLETDSATEDQRMEESEEISKVSQVTNPSGESNGEAPDVPDLEKMTLGEWFDYLEMYLPKQIYAVTDEIIDDMRKRAKQFDAFLLQHQKGKVKLSRAT